MRSTALLSFFTFTIAVFHTAPAAADVVDDVLASNRISVGGAYPPATIRTQYIYTGQGLSGTVIVRFDTLTGAYATKSDLGAIIVGSGYDGTTPWMRDISGAYTRQDGGDRVRLAVNEAYRYANLWWRTDRGGAEIVYLGRETIGRETFQRLAVTPRGGTRFEAWFNARSRLLAQVAERQLFFNTRTFYQDYKRRDGFMIPTKLIVDGGTGEASYASMVLTDVSRQRTAPLSDYAAPSAAPTGVTIDDERRSATLPFRLLNNHIYIEAMVEGRGPYTFIVDTGGHTILSSRIVREAGLSPAGAAPSSGAGAETITSGYAKVREIAFGPIRMHDQTAITMDIYDPAVEGIRVDGMIGFELLRRLALEIDYGRSRLTFTRFEDFDAAAAGVAVPFTFYDHLPQVEGRIADIPALFDIDTGSRNEVDMTSPFVTANKLDTRFPGSIKAMTGWGVGGPSMSQVVRAPSLTLGSVVIHHPVIGLSRATAGSFSDSNFGGNVGSGLLKRFVTSFDYSKQIMYLKSLAPPPLDAGTFDRSGMWLNAGTDRFIVAYISPGGAAEAAGIKKDDIVTAINGRPAVAAELSDVRTMFRTKAHGDRVLVTLVRDGRSEIIPLILRDRL
ncbi:MAG: aspartyl protease family protein [Sphingomonadales bacterium]